MAQPVIVGTTDVTRITYRNRNGVLTNPDNIVAISKRPDGVVGVNGAVITEVSTGIRDVDLPLSEAGIWYLEVTATGTIAAKVLEKTICVRASSVA